MKNRKSELLFCSAVVSLALAGCKNEPLAMIVGTYTDECASRGVYSYFFDQEKGMLVDSGEEGRFEEAPGAVGRVEMRNPSYLTLSAGSLTLNFFNIFTREASSLFFLSNEIRIFVAIFSYFEYEAYYQPFEERGIVLRAEVL